MAATKGWTIRTGKFWFNMTQGAAGWADDPARAFRFASREAAENYLATRLRYAAAEGVVEKAAPVPADCTLAEAQAEIQRLKREIARLRWCLLASETKQTKSETYKIGSR